MHGKALYLSASEQFFANLEFSIVKEVREKIATFCNTQIFELNLALNYFDICK